jgi:hypothetical protein
MKTRRSFEEWAQLYSAKVEPFVLRQPEAVLFHEAHGIMTFAIDPVATQTHRHQGHWGWLLLAVRCKVHSGGPGVEVRALPHDKGPQISSPEIPRHVAHGKSESGWWMEVSAGGWQRNDNGEPKDHP